MDLTSEPGHLIIWNPQVIPVNHDPLSGCNSSGQPFELLLVRDFIHIQKPRRTDSCETHCWNGRKVER